MKMIDKCRSAIRPLGLAVALCFSVAPAANATTLSNFLTFDGPVHHTPIPFQGGGEDKLQDDSLTAFFNADGSTTVGGIPTITVGDVVFGYITLSEVSASGAPSKMVGAASQIAVMFSAMITGAGSGGSFALGATPAGPTLAAICGPLCAPAGLLPTSVAVVLSTTQSSTVPANDPLNWDVAGANGFTGNFNGANGNGPWSWEATLGLSGDSFFEFMGSVALGGTERGAFDITSTAFNDASTDFHPVDVLDHGATAHINDATLDTGTIGIASGPEQLRGWTFRDQGTFYVNPLPEPGVLALMGIALAGVAGLTRRRRKQ